MEDQDKQLVDSNARFEKLQTLLNSDEWKIVLDVMDEVTSEALRKLVEGEEIEANRGIVKAYQELFTRLGSEYSYLQHAHEMYVGKLKSQVKEG